MSGKVYKKIRKMYRSELKTEAFKNHDAVWQQINSDLTKRLQLHRKLSFGLAILLVGSVVLNILLGLR